MGVRQFQVKHLTVYVPDLPEAFEGYRIVHFSDIHVGSYYGWRRHMPQRDVDSINAQHPDLICFTGDLQNVRPEELIPFKKTLSGLKAKDGVVSVLGNHDYTYYMNVDDEAEIRRIEEKVQQTEHGVASADE